MIRRASAAVLALTLLSAGVAAAARTPAQTTPQTAAPANPLAIMVVPRAQLGTAVQGLQVDLASGPTENARAAAGTLDPTDDSASLAKDGRLSGYTLHYGDPGFTALRRKHGLVDLGTSVDLFKNQAQAQAYRLKALRSLRGLFHRNIGGVVIERATAFQVPGLGPNSVGVRMVHRIGSKRLYVTAIDFQVDRILCEAEVTRADATRTDGQATAIAQKLLGRIVAYAQNQLNAKPETLARPPGMRRPEAGAPDLEAMALPEKSLKGKAGVFDQGYAADEKAVIDYQREFRYDPKTGLFLLQNHLMLQRTRREAAGRMLLLRAAETGPGAASTIAQQFLGGAAASKSHPKLDGTRPLGIGEESFATSVVLDTPSGPTKVVYAYVRRNRVIGTIVLAGAPGKVALGDVVPYVKELDGRIRDAFPKKSLAA